jgi:hypothetical protein
LILSYYEFNNRIQTASLELELEECNNILLASF